MSSGLMSCVRENSPPLDVHEHNASGPLSLPADTSNVSMNITSTPLAAINVNSSSSGSGNSGNDKSNAASATTSAEQQKRRRFHPLRNLRRIFRRRTITSAADTPPSSYRLPPQQVNSNSEKNLRSATLSSISSAVSASSPSSPLTHQQLQDAYSSQSLPKSKSSFSTTSGGGFGKPLRDALLAATGGRHKHQQPQKEPKERKDSNNINENDDNANANDNSHDMYTTTSSTSYQQYHHHQHVMHQQQRESGGGGSGNGSTIFLPQRQSLGVAVLPGAMNRSFYAERQKLRSAGDSSSQDLDSSGNDSASNNGGTAAVSQGGGARANGSGEITDSQRSLSEGRLVDSDYSHDQMSQSHDSVFSESATASSLSIVLKAELADVLRKRRNRPDASDEDLGLPRSPASPQPHQNNSHATNSSSNGGSSAAARLYKITTSTATATATSAGGNQSSEKSSLSLLSINSNDNDDFLLTSTANNSAADVSNYSISSSGNRFIRSSTVSSTSDVQYRQHTASATTLSLTSANRNHHSFDDSASTNRDECDFFSGATSSSFQRLSHSAAKHKMAIKPMKKKGGPSRHQRRTLETSIPEANEDSLKMGSGKHNFMDHIDHDVRAKTRSLPPGVNAAKLLEQHVTLDNNNKKTITTTTTTASTSPIILPTTTATEKTITEMHHDDLSLNNNNKRTKIEKSSTTATSSTATSTSGSTNLFGLRALTAKATAMFESKETTSNIGASSSSAAATATTTGNSDMETTESGFLRRLMQRNSKRTIASRANGGDDEFDMTQSEPKKLQISTSNYEVKQLSAAADLGVLEKSKSAISYEQNVEETRKEIKREIMSVGSTGLSAMLNTFMLSEKSASSNAKEMQQQVPKPKSGAAARQRYLPQDISGDNSLEKKTSSSAASASKESYNTTSLLTKPPTGAGAGASATMGASSSALQQHHETFQSTSIIREITASQTAATTTNSNISLNSSKSEYHFEKKPKIVGLSAFQQKISRSNDSFVRTTSTSSTNTSSNSLETAGAETAAAFLNFEKQRKSVEKSRSFRTYDEEERETSASSASSARGFHNGTGTAGVHNNMPSLPDLTLNLRVPCFGEFILNEKQYSSPSPPPTGDQHDKSISLGFEINDNNLVKPVTAPLRAAESAGNLPFYQHQQQSNYAKNIILTSTTNAKSTTPTKLLTPSSHNNCVMSSLSPTNSCNKNISEIEQNIDLIVKSPFISVLRKSTTSTTGNNDVVMVNNKMNAALGDRIEESSSGKQESKMRPKHLNFKERTVVVKCEEEKLTPTTAAVPLREKSKAAVLNNSADCGSVVILTSNANTKETERKSAPVFSTQQQQLKTNSFKATRRSSSLLDAPHNQVADEAATTTPTTDVPEFMKIQLNRVDPARIAKSSNIVLSKNAKETITITTAGSKFSINNETEKRENKEKSAERSASIDDLSMRRLSNESVEITENDTAENTPRERHISGGVFEAINKQANKLGGSVGNIRCSSSNGSSNNSSYNNSELTTPKSPTKKSFGLNSPLKTPTASAASTPDNEEHVVLRTKVTSDTASTPTTAESNKLSLQERKRLFMNEEKMKVDRKIEEMRQERKKSINEEVYRKSIASKSEEKLESTTTTSTSAELLESSTVILRKKSFNATTAAAQMQQPQSMQNGGSANNNHKEDATPELMKVFARRSLKIKDEDLNALNEKIMMHNSGVSGSSGSTANTAKKFMLSVQTSPNVDSDKENQSSSEEKLDKLPKIEMLSGGGITSENQYHHHTITCNNRTTSNTSLNGSVNRNSLADFRKNISSGITSNGLSLSNNHNNNNNNNNNNYNNSLTTATAAPATPTTTFTTSTSGTKSFLPPIKKSAGGFRTIPIERNGSVNKLFNNNETFNLNNNNNNAFNNNANKPATLERQSLNIKKLEHNHHSAPATSTSSSNSFSTPPSAAASTTTSKTIERSATVSEFKGIHQRRAEWEQRAKEALK